MAEVLSQAQIDALLSGLNTGSVDMEEVEKPSSKKVKEYDFRSPKKFTKEQLRQVESIYENFSRLFSSYLTSVLRIYCQVTMQATEEQRYHEFNNALPDSVLIGVIDVVFDDTDMPESQILVEISRPISFAIMDRLLGGNGEGVGYDREYTEIELSLLDNLFRQFIPLLKDAWNTYYEVGVSYNHIETNSRLLQSMRSDEIAVIVVMDVSIKSLKGSISICMPSILLENLFKKSSLRRNARMNRRESMNEEIRRDTIMTFLKTTNLDVKAILSESEITLREVLELQRGDVITLDKLVGTDVTVKVGNSTWFNGKLGLVRNKKAIKITTVQR